MEVARTWGFWQQDPVGEPLTHPRPRCRGIRPPHGQTHTNILAAPWVYFFSITDSWFVKHLFLEEKFALEDLQA